MIRRRKTLCTAIKTILCVCLSVYTVSYFGSIILGEFDDPLANKEIRAVKFNSTTNTSTIDDITLIEFTEIIAQSQKQGRYNIPKIIHQSWNNYNIPEMTVNWVKRWSETNPDWMYVFWTDHSSREFIRKFYPEYLPMYDGFELPVQRADVFRYFILWTIGGAYADLDVEPLRSLNEVANLSPCILSQEPKAHHRLLHPEFSKQENNFTLSCNAFMMCRNRHPYMAFLIKTIAERRAKVPKCSLPETLLCTGPYIVSTAWVQYKALYLDDTIANPQNDVICPEADYFLPTWDPLRTGWIKIICLSRKRYEKLEDKDKQICDDLKRKHFKNKPQDWSYTNHHWFHSWTDERKRYLGARYSRTHIYNVIPQVVYGEDLTRQ